MKDTTPGFTLSDCNVVNFPLFSSDTVVPSILYYYALELVKIGGDHGIAVATSISHLTRIPSPLQAAPQTLPHHNGIMWQSTHLTAFQPGDQVLVISGGVIGTMIVKTMRALGIDCHINVPEPSPFHAEFIREAGADRVITDGDLFSHTVDIKGASPFSFLPPGQLHKCSQTCLMIAPFGNCVFCSAAL